MLNIAIVDDHLPTIKRFSTFAKTILKTTVSYEAENGYAFLQKFNSNKPLPKLMLIDINMPVMDGIALTYFMKVHYPTVKIICLSIYYTPEIIKTAFLAGANAYVLKSVAEKNLQNAVTKIIQDAIYIDPHTEITVEEILSFLEKYKNRPGEENTWGLTKRERTFVMLSATMLNYEQIAELMHVDIRTVHTYFEQVKEKCNTPTRYALLLFALQNGLAIHANYSLAI